MTKPTQPEEFFIVSINHCMRSHRYIAFFAPDCRGYASRLHKAGRYSREVALGYNSGCASVAVPCEVLERIAVPPAPGYFDEDDGVVVENCAKNWREILKNTIARPKYKPQPAYKGGRLRDWEK